MADSIIKRPEQGLISDEVLSPVMDLVTAKKRLQEFQLFIKDYLIEDEDFGVIPGTGTKKTLLKPGADKLCELYGLSDSYDIIEKIEDYNANPPLFDYTVQCVLTRAKTGIPVSAGLGSCSTWESKYRYRDSKRSCPECNAEAIIKGKEEYGGGFLCFAKKGGCGAKFKEDDKRITKQKLGQVENPDIMDQKNTVLKMAKKRAKIDATLSATRSSGVFTQDVEDMDVGQGSQPPAPAVKGNPPAKPSGKPAGRATQQQSRSEDVLCAHCGGKNGHTKDCPTLDSNKEKKEVAKESEFEARIVVQSVEDKETIKKAKFQVIKAAKEDGDAIDLYVWHGTLRENTKHLIDVWSDVVIKSKPSTKDPNAVIYSLDKVLRTFPDGDTVEWIDNVPTNPDAEPEP
jgi:hypothetical protein